MLAGSNHCREPHRMELLAWDVYDISADESSLNGVMLRGRIRKYGIEHHINVLAENTEDRENGVRFAVLESAHADAIGAYVLTIIPDASIALLESGVQNPVLSKAKVNITDRYSL